MAEIYHVIDIKCNPRRLFDALTEPSLLQQWWLPKVKGKIELDGLYEFWAGDHVYNQMRIIELIDNQLLRWLCENESDDNEWKNTEIQFEIQESSSANSLTLHFRHSKWKESTSFFGLCNYHWGRHLEQLKNLCESEQTKSLHNENRIADEAFKKWKNEETPIVNLKQKLARIDEYWSPRIIAELNGQHVKLAKLKGEFVWHSHAEEDELFMVIEGLLHIEMRTGTVVLGPGEIYVVPKGVEHKPIAKEEVSIMLFEPISTLNTGDAEDDRTRKELDWI